MMLDIMLSVKRPVMNSDRVELQELSLADTFIVVVYVVNRLIVGSTEGWESENTERYSGYF